MDCISCKTFVGKYIAEKQNCDSCRMPLCNDCYNNSYHMYMFYVGNNKYELKSNACKTCIIKREDAYQIMMKERQQMLLSASKHSIKIIKDLFDSTVGKTGDKYFSISDVKEKTGTTGPQYIYGWGSFTENDPYLKIEYKYDDVEIYYYKRVTTHLGDTDTFTDYYVKVEGQYLLNVEYQ